MATKEYTPEFLRELLAWEGATCAMPECATPIEFDERESARRDWHLCAFHWRSLEAFLAVQDLQYAMYSHEGFSWTSSELIVPETIEAEAPAISRLDYDACFRCASVGNFGVALPSEWVRVNGRFEEVERARVLYACPFHIQELRTAAKRFVGSHGSIFYGWVNPDFLTELLFEAEDIPELKPYMVELFDNGALDADACIEGFDEMKEQTEWQRQN